MAQLVTRKAAVVALIAIAAAAPACKKGEEAKADAAKPAGSASASAPKKAPTFPVNVAKVEGRKVDYLVTAVGTVEAFEEVQVVARVAGAVERVRFQEGDVVKAGALLVEIDPARFDATARSAAAALDRARASRKDAELSLARREQMGADGLASHEDLDVARTRVATAAADEAGARAALDLAQLNVRDAHVRAPVSGVMQSREVRTGQYVQAGTLLGTLVQRDPLRLRFEVPEQEARALEPKMVAKVSVRGLGAALDATITHVSEAADPKTRMVTLLARIDHPPDELRPGAFAEVSVITSSKQDVPVVAQAAARPTAKGFVAFVVQDGVAKERVLDLGLRTVDGLVEVRSGLVPGDQLVVRGAEALRDGAQVRVETGRPAPSGSASAGAAPTAPPAPAASASPGAKAP